MLPPCSPRCSIRSDRMRTSQRYTCTGNRVWERRFRFHYSAQEQCTRSKRRRKHSQGFPMRRPRWRRRWMSPCSRICHFHRCKPCRKRACNFLYHCMALQRYTGSKCRPIGPTSWRRRLLIETPSRNPPCRLRYRSAPARPAHRSSSAAEFRLLGTNELSSLSLYAPMPDCPYDISSI